MTPLAWLGLWAIRLLLVALVTVFLTECVMRLGKLGQYEETPLEKRGRDNMDKNRRKGLR